MDVLTVGHMLYDVRCYVEVFPQPDKTALIEQPIHTSSGGSAANVAIDLSMLGSKAGIICCIGLDRHGKYLFEDLKTFKVDRNGVEFKKGKSGMSIVLIDRNAEVEVIESVGVCDSHVEVDKDYVADFRHVHVTGTNFKTATEAVDIAYKKGLSVSFDPGRSKSALGEKKLSGILAKSSQLFVNRKELSLIFGRQSEIPERDIGAYASVLAKRHSLDVCVKGGSHDIIIASSKDGSFTRFSPYDVKVVDTIGAGDAFAAGFIHSFLDGKKLLQCAKFGAGCSAQEIEKQGAHSGLDKKKLLKRYGPY